MRMPGWMLGICAGSSGGKTLVDSYLDRVSAASLGPIAPAAVTAMRQYFADISRANLLEKLIRCNLDVGPDLASSLIPQINTTGATVDTAVGTVTHSDALGWASDGTTGYIKTGLVPGSLGGLGVYVREPVTSSTTGYVPIGASGPSTAQVVRVAFNRAPASTIAGNSVGNWGGTVPASGVDGGADIAAGYWSVERFGTALARMCRNGVQKTDNTTTITLASAGVELYVLAQNLNGTVGAIFQAGKHVSGYDIWSGALSLSQRMAAYNAKLAFETAMGRQAGAVAARTVSNSSTTTGVITVTGGQTLSLTITATTTDAAARCYVGAGGDTSTPIGDVSGAVNDVISIVLPSDATQVHFDYSGVTTGSISFTGV